VNVLLLAMPNVGLGYGYHKMIAVPNLGLCSIAGNAGGHRIKVADLVLFKGDIRSYIRRLLRDFSPDVVGLSCMSFQYRTAIEVAKEVKGFRKDTPVVLGGYHPTLACDEISESGDSRFIDFIVRGEGELTFRELLQALSGRRSLSDVDGLSYKADGKLHHNRPRSLCDLEGVSLQLQLLLHKGDVREGPQEI